MSIYKRFRSVQEPVRDAGGAQTGSGAYALSPRFDQPTYLSFRLVFAEDDAYYNNAANKNFVLNYDRMPHPLFASAGKADVFEREAYSSISYLNDANEFTRAAMLKNFISLWNKLQYDYQWYFQKIDGVSELLKIDHTKGMRVTSDKRLTVTALEGVDLRLTHLLNMYRKIAWDDTYQRWVLPDMMRYFTLNIYISEFRTFHTPNPYDGYGVGSVANNVKTTPSQLRLDILDDIMPIWKIRCEMCEFDLQTVEFDHLGSLGVDDMPTEAGVKFGIKVGKVYEEQIYPTFKNSYLIDKALNGLDRSKEEETFSTSNRINPVTGEIDNQDVPPYQLPFDSTSVDANNNSTIRDNKTILRVAQNELYNTESHTSGTPFNEQANKENVQGVNAHEGLPLSEATKGDNEEPAAGNTWMRNAGQLGLSYLENKFEEVLDKAKITPIPGLGVSFTEVQSALQGKNIITALGLLRKGVNNVVTQYGQPSELLEGNIYVDDAFRAYLEGISKSEATNETEISLIEAANIALNDDGTWGKIKDFSLATNLEGEGEENTEVKIRGDFTPAVGASRATNRNIESGDLYASSASSLNNNIPDEYDQSDVASSLNNNIPDEYDQVVTNRNNTISPADILEGIPSSQATTNKLQNG